MLHLYKPLDVAFMKAIHNKVNIVPVIAKADTLTLKERERLKKRVRAGLPGPGRGVRTVPAWLVYRAGLADVRAVSVGAPLSSHNCVSQTNS